jgi:hypothetical protein
MRSVARLSIGLVVASLVAGACGAGAATSPAQTEPPSPAPTVADPTPTPAPTERPTATPMAMTDGEGPEYVVGSSSLTVTKSPTETVVGDVTQYRGQEMTSSGTMSDQRVTGTQVITLNGDLYGTVMPEWGTTRIENADGAWEGTWTGASWNNGTSTSVSGWLVGSGAYEGWTYYFHVHGPHMPYNAEGIIFKGSQPTP